MPTPPNAIPSASLLPTSKVKVPQHIVYRSFPAETVVLNLQTGKYHGLNATAGSMLDALGKADCLHDAAVAVAGEYGQPAASVEQDMCELCNLLLARGLIELDGESER
jgi:hypothetical protein